MICIQDGVKAQTSIQIFLDFNILINIFSKPI